MFMRAAVLRAVTGREGSQRVHEFGVYHPVIIAAK
jgi:hypothetical protein